VIVNNWEHTNQRIEFESRSRGYANAVQSELSKYLGALNFLGDFFNNSQQVTLQQFNVFAESALSRYPGIQAFSWNPLVKGNERTVYESLARKEGLKNFRFTERTEKGALVDAAQRQEYVVVYYITPLETNKPALGYDIASDRTRLQAIDKAFKTGELTVTNRITLVQETGTQFGVLVFLPLYQQGVSLKTSEARLKYRKGLVVEVLRLGDVVEAALEGFPDEGINVYLYDASAAKGNRFLYARPSRMPGMTEQLMDEDVIQKDIHWSNNFEIAGSQWKILCTPSTLFLDLKHSWQSWLVLSGSLLLTAILILYLLRKSNYAAEIESRVREQLRTNQELADEMAERKQAEETIRKEKQLSDSIIENTPAGIAFLDNDLILRKCNNTYADLIRTYTPYTPEQALGMCYYDYAPGSRPQVEEWYEKVRDSGQVDTRYGFKLALNREGRDLITYWDTSVAPALNQDGKVEGLLILTQDVTERQLAEETLRASEEKYRLHFENVSDVIFSFDREFRILSISPSVERVLGYKPEEFIGKPFPELNILPPESLEKAFKDGMRILAGERIDSIVLDLVARDGTRNHFEFSGTPLLREGQVLAAVCVARDITDRKQAEEALQEYSERLEEMVEERTKELRDTRDQLVRCEKLAVLGQLAGGVAHELRNPLAVMNNAIYYLTSINTDADETTREYLELISSEIGNAEAIVSDLLDFSRTRSLEREQVTAAELVVRVLEKHPPPEKVKVTTGIPPELPPLFVDPRQIGQVLENLVANAYQAMAAGGQVTITAELMEADPIRDPKSIPEEYASHSTGQAICIRITDTGCGISKENMEKIFEPLFTTRARGIGLGLAIVKNLAELNSGSIKVQSEAGKGSTFTIALPVREVIS